MGFGTGILSVYTVCHDVEIHHHSCLGIYIQTYRSWEAYPCVTLASSATTFTCGSCSSAWSAIARLSSRSSKREPAHAGPLVSTLERVTHTNARIAPQRQIAQHILILLIKEILRPDIQQNAVTKFVVPSNIKPRVPRIPRKPQPKKIRVRAHSREVPANGETNAPPLRVQRERSRIYRPP